MKKWFTLIELVIVMSVISILWLLSFIWFQWFNKEARNAVRISDVNNITKSLELFSINSGFFPDPSNSVEITYLSWSIWSQWTVWESVITNLSKNLNKVPLDPLNKQEYVYSLLNNKTEYQIKINYEESLSALPINNVFASNDKCHIRWNYNWKLVSLETNNIIHILAIPSIIIDGVGETSLLKIIEYKKYLYDYTSSEDRYTPEKLELYSWSIEWLKDITSKTNFLSNYKNAYINYKDKDEVMKNIDKMTINIDNYDSDMDNIANNLLLSTVKKIPNKDFFTENKKRFVIDNFVLDKVYEEVWESSRNFDDRWWVNSWAFFFVKSWTWSTVQWELEQWSKWQVSYSKYNWWLETDMWYHPQNIFRLILNEKFRSFIQSAYFKIDKYILSDDPHRWDPNWLLLFNRYVDSDNLYYTWIRVDWAVVIKKKYKWVYYTLAYNKILEWTYNRTTNPNLIPINKWIWIKSEVKNLSDTIVSIKLYIDKNNDWNWQLSLSVLDSLKSSWQDVINESWYAWIRTDFMDVEIDNYNINEI